MHMIRHQNVGMQVVMPQLTLREVKGLDNHASDSLVAEPKRTYPSRIEVAVGPNESLAGRPIARLGKAGGWQTPVQVPGDKQRPAHRILVRKTTLVSLHWVGPLVSRCGLVLGDEVAHSATRHATGVRHGGDRPAEPRVRMKVGYGKYCGF